MDYESIAYNNEEVELGPTPEFDNKLKDSIEYRISILEEFMREFKHISCNNKPIKISNEIGEIDANI